MNKRLLSYIFIFLFYVVATATAATQNSSGIHGFSGTSRTVATTTGTLTSGDCVKIDANGNFVANGSACAGAGSVSTTGSPASGNLTKFSGAATITNGDLSGDVSTSGTLTTAIGSNKVTDAMLRQSGALSLIGRSANSTGNVADISASADANIMRRSGTSIGFGSIDLAASGAVGSSILGTANGGTANAFFTVSGPATTAKTFTFPNASSTVLTSNAAVTVAQGGTGLATLTANNVILGNGTSTPTFVAPSTSGNVLTSNGTTWTSAAAASSVPTGGVVNTITYIYTTNGPVGTTALPIDDTIPQITEGNQVFSQAYTMASTTNKLRIEFEGAVAGTAATAGCAIFYDGGANAIAAVGAVPGSVSTPEMISLTHEFVPASTASKTIEIRCGNNGGTALRFNGTTSARLFGGVSNTTMKLTEIKA